jgi:hypothetical protein
MAAHRKRLYPTLTQESTSGSSDTQNLSVEIDSINDPQLNNPFFNPIEVSSMLLQNEYSSESSQDLESESSIMEQISSLLPTSSLTQMINNLQSLSSMLTVESDITNDSIPLPNDLHQEDRCDSLPKSSSMIPVESLRLLLRSPSETQVACETAGDKQSLSLEETSFLLPKRDSVPPGESLRLLLRSPTETQVEETSFLLPKSYRILVFSWNTESISICETMSDQQAAFNRSGYTVPVIGTKLSRWRYPADIPDFYPKLIEMIQQNSPDIVVIGFQEDRHPGSYFHSHLLPEEMPKIGYDLVKRTKLMGVGVTTYKGLKKGDLFRRGIRVSVYAKSCLVPLILKEETEMRKSMGNDGQDEYVCTSVLTRGKGATASYLLLPGFGQLAFVCCHLPFNARSLITERIYQNRMLRQNEINQSNICFNSIIENLILFRETVPTHVIFFGDFNYRLSVIDRPASEIAAGFLVHGEKSEFVQEMYDKYDELKEQIRRRNIYPFAEGIDNEGPTFIPTCKMRKNRTNITSHEMWNTGKDNQRVPSWCDRILYSKFGDDGHNLVCTYYDRFDHGEVMSKSDHAGVISMFELV